MHCSLPKRIISTVYNGKGQTLSENNFTPASQIASLLGLLQFTETKILERGIYVYEESFSFLFRQVGMG